MIDFEKVAEWVVEVYPNAIWSPTQLDALQRFAALAQADAFDLAAVVCDEQQLEPECPERASYCAEAIRALKEKV